MAGTYSAPEVEWWQGTARTATKIGDRYLRKLLVVGMTAVVRHAKSKPQSADPYLLALLKRKPVPMANKTARIVWAAITRG